MDDSALRPVDDFAAETMETGFSPAVSKQKSNHVIQSMLLPPREFSKDLYVRTLHEQTGDNVFLQSENGVVTLQSHARLSLNTYFNSFYEAYWAKYTELEEITFDLNFAGLLKVEVFHDSVAGSCQLVHSQIIASSGGVIPRRPKRRAAAQAGGKAYGKVALREPNSTTIDIGKMSPLFPRPRGRYFVDITALEKSEIYSAGYSTPDTPQRDITLSVGLCTFNREPYLTRTLQQIQQEADGNPAIKHVFIVNQGKAFETDAIKKVLKDPRFELIIQDNYGGCGGFTRTIAEAQNLQPEVTHHLLMDDDIILDARVISRSITFLNYCSRDVGLGGSMFDSIRPSFMYEGGAFLRPNNTIKPFAHNVNMADLGGPGHFNDVVNTDYNAWWYFILPVAKSREIKLPAPIFIRGDDFEYGQRLAAAGVPTVSLPGVGIWHEPFYVKPPGWQRYYDLRNRLIFGATYQGKVNKIPALEILDMLLSRLYAHDYASHALLEKAVNDYLDGPDALFAVDPAAKHQEVNKVNAANAIPTATKEEVQHLKQGQVRKPVAGTARLAAHYYRRALSMLFLPLDKEPKRIYVDADAHPNSIRRQGYVMTNGPQTFHLKFQPDRAKFTKGLAASLRLARRYSRENQAVMKHWNDRIEHYRDPAIWEPMFAPKPD